MKPRLSRAKTYSNLFTPDETENFGITTKIEEVSFNEIGIILRLPELADFPDEPINFSAHGLNRYAKSGATRTKTLDKSVGEIKTHFRRNHPPCYFHNAQKSVNPNMSGPSVHQSPGSEWSDDRQRCLRDNVKRQQSSPGSRHRSSAIEVKEFNDEQVLPEQCIWSQTELPTNCVKTAEVNTQVSRFVKQRTGSKDERRMSNYSQVTSEHSLRHKSSKCVEDKTSQPAPDPPGNLTARLVTIDDRWLISWTAPPMDEGGENNGVKVIGYRVTFNETEVKRVSSPFLTSAIVMLPRCPNAEFQGTIKVQSIGASEVFSEAVDMALNAA